MTSSANPEFDEFQGLASWRYVCEIPEFPLDYRTTALIVIDLQHQQASREHGFFKRLADGGLSEDSEFAINRVESLVCPNAKRLAESFREHGAPVIYTRCASVRGDGSDQTWRHRQFGIFCTLDSKDAQLLDAAGFRDGDILLTKSGSSVFNSTNLEHILRNMGMTTIVVSGIWTNSCVEGATRDAGDLDFRVALAEDACTAMSPRGHANALEYLDKNFCHVWSTDEILERLTTGTAKSSAETEMTASAT